jgi:hypothetical protein
MKKGCAHKQKKSKNIKLFTKEANIKRALRKHLASLGFKKDKQGNLCPPDLTKECFRELHSAQRKEKIEANSKLINGSWPGLKQYFAKGSEVLPQLITPRLELVYSDTWQSELFRLASLTWSVPVSQGYGRRMRFLVWDDSNGKLIGLFALGDPVFNLAVRDNWIGWNTAQRKEKLVNVLDAYVLGAVPPYNFLLGGKLIASLINSREVRDAFRSRYKKTTGIISQKNKNAELCLVTTTSALGRSSIYNRLKLDGQKIFTSIGFTSGWGHFHIPENIFSKIREYLTLSGDKYADNHKFGDGPNWKLRSLRKTLKQIGMNPDILKHGIAREVFVCPLAQNAKQLLKGKHKRPNFSGLKAVHEISQLAKERWIVPRSEHRTNFKNWDNKLILDLIYGTLQYPQQNIKQAAIRGA